MPDDHSPKPILTVDVVPLTIHQERLCVLLAKRPIGPFAEQTDLIGGEVSSQQDATLGATARRLLDERAGIRDLYVEQLSTFSGAHRDPRGWSVGVAYFALSPFASLEAALDRPGFELAPVEHATGMPFDHDLMLASAVARLHGKGAYSDLPARFLPSEFTLAELHRTYQIALGERINADAFRRKVLERGFLEPVGSKRTDEWATKPAKVMRLKPGLAVFDRRL